MARVRVVRTYLELRAADALRGVSLDDPTLRLIPLAPNDVALFRQLYRDVGDAHSWHDRNVVSDDELRSHFESPDVAVWVLFQDVTPAGFFELRRHTDGSVEIVYFGLTAAFVGRGLGKHLLSRAVECAWAFGANRVWLHTCTLDAPAALPNYLARGFEPYRTETYEATVRDDPTRAPND
jgi:GNAT superfamily N-acetyltransferase